MSSRNQTALAYAPQDGKLHPSVSPQLARAFDGFFGPPARELHQGPGADRRSAEHPSCRPDGSQASLPAYTVLGRY
jgi:hypothetical protein